MKSLLAIGIIGVLGAGAYFAVSRTTTPVVPVPVPAMTAPAAPEAASAPATLVDTPSATATPVATPSAAATLVAETLPTKTQGPATRVAPAPTPGRERPRAEKPAATRTVPASAFAPTSNAAAKSATAIAAPPVQDGVKPNPSAPRAPESVADPAPVTPPAAAPAAQLPPPPPDKPRYDELTVDANAVMGVRLDSTINSESARVEDRVNARLSRDVMVDGRVAVAVGSRLEGVVTEVVRGGKFKERARIGMAFQTLVLADGTRIAIKTDTVFREGEPPSNVNQKVGGSAVVGAIIGAMIGGKKGALVGGSAGAAGGAAAVAAGDRADVVLTSGSALTVRLSAPITVIVEKHHNE